MDKREGIDPTHTILRVRNGKVVERTGWQPGIDEIPDTPTSRRVFDALRDLLHRLAAELIETASGATRDFMLSNFPNARTIRKDYVNRQYRRIIEVDGENYAVIYDFKTKTTVAAELSEAV
jgi:hypothetical protein